MFALGFFIALAGGLYAVYRFLEAIFAVTQDQEDYHGR